MNLISIRTMITSVTLLASTLMAACGLRSTNSSNETLTVYEDAPTLTHVDLGPPGNSPGDVYHFFAPLRSSPGGPVTGEVLDPAGRCVDSLRGTAKATRIVSQKDMVTKSVEEEITTLGALDLSGGPVATRTPDLYRVKVAL